VVHDADVLLADPPDQLRPFIRDGKITSMPARRTRRRLLLDQVAQAFQPGRTYPEAAVDEAFMSRTASGTYWRAGGTVI
jgi:hypothetical protein